MNEENLNPDAEQGVNQEGELPETETLDSETETDSKGDPLDQISDLEALRAEAKKYRGIAGRKDKGAPARETVVETSAMLKKDFYRINERKAINEITAANPEIEANFEAIKSFYVARHGKDTPEDVRKDLDDAYILWKARQGATSNDSTIQLTSTSVVRPSGQGSTPSTPTTDNDPRFSAAARPDSWYGKPQ